MTAPLSPRATGIIVRLRLLLDTLRAGPLARPTLLEQLGDAYAPPRSRARTLDRDIEHLATLGIVIARSGRRPVVYALRGGTPAFAPDELRALSLFRDTFGANHPLAAPVRALLDHLTARLAEAEQEQYASHRALSVGLQPAIDYTPYAALLRRLEQALSARELLRFRYRSSRGALTLHRMVEPHDLEFYERHFYLVAYSHNSGQIHEFRIDRILYDAEFTSLHRLPPGTERARPLVAFRYRLAATLAQGEISQRFEQQRVVERLANGDVIIEAQGRSDFFIVRTLLRYAGNAELLWPPQLRAAMAREVAALTKLYSSDE